MLESGLFVPIPIFCSNCFKLIPVFPYAVNPDVVKYNTFPIILVSINFFSL